MRLTASHVPLAAPYFSRASSAYWEQAGLYRQHGRFSGEMYFR